MAAHCDGVSCLSRTCWRCLCTSSRTTGRLLSPPRAACLSSPCSLFFSVVSPRQWRYLPFLCISRDGIVTFCGSGRGGVTLEDELFDGGGRLRGDAVIACCRDATPKLSRHGVLEGRAARRLAYELAAVLRQRANVCHICGDIAPTFVAAGCASSPAAKRAGSGLCVSRRGQQASPMRRAKTVTRVPSCCRLMAAARRALRWAYSIWKNDWRSGAAPLRAFTAVRSAFAVLDFHFLSFSRTSASLFLPKHLRTARRGRRGRGRRGRGQAARRRLSALQGFTAGDIYISS